MRILLSSKISNVGKNIVNFDSRRKAGQIRLQTWKIERPNNNIEMNSVAVPSAMYVASYLYNSLPTYSPNTADSFHWKLVDRLAYSIDA